MHVCALRDLSKVQSEALPELEKAAAAISGESITWHRPAISSKICPSRSGESYQDRKTH